MNVKTLQALKSNLNTARLYPTSIPTNEADSGFLKSSEISQLCAVYIDPVNNGCELADFYPFTDIEKVAVRTLNKHLLCGSCEWKNPKEMVSKESGHFHYAFCCLHVALDYKPNKSNRPIRLTQCCTQFKSLGVRVLWVFHSHDKVAFTLK